MSKVFIALAVSVDGYITGRDPEAGRGLGNATMLFDWYFDGDTPSQVFDGFRLSEPSARVFDSVAGRVGASLSGRNTYDDSGWGAGGTPHPAAPLVVLSHRCPRALPDSACSGACQRPRRPALEHCSRHVSRYSNAVQEAGLGRSGRAAAGYRGACRARR